MSFTKRVLAWTIIGHQRELLVDPDYFENRGDYGWFIAWDIDGNNFLLKNAETVEFDDMNDSYTDD